MARESQRPSLLSSEISRASPGPGTPQGRRAVSAELTTSAASRRSIQIRTPGSRTLPLRPSGLSASGRKPQPGPSATPHARAAFRTIDSRRAAISTPHRAGRRKSVREARETPRDFLLQLGKALAPKTTLIASSSSPRDGSALREDDIKQETGDEDGGDDDDEDLPKRPRLSLHIEEDDLDDYDLRPHQSAGLEDEEYTVRSVEMPRRAYSEQPGSRMSMGSVRMSDFFGRVDEDEGEVRIPEVFPPMGDESRLDDEIPDYERSELDLARRETLARVSDFGIEVPLDMANETTVMLEPEIQESPTRPLEFFEPMMGQRSDSDAGGFDDMGIGDDVGNMDGDDEDDIAEVESGAEETVVDLEAATAKSAAKRSAKKRTTKLSRHGIEYPSLPPAVVKRLAQTFAKSSGAKGKIAPDTLQALVQASDWFFEQIGEDLEAYSHHAHRKTIDESDMVTLMKRQRQISAHMTPFALAQRYLPRELLQELRMTPPAPTKKRKRSADVVEDETVT
ncbi:hypothetical protein OQA88_7272 [Cercophora sp. LCS_1]